MNIVAYRYASSTRRSRINEIVEFSFYGMFHIHRFYVVPFLPI